MSDLNLKMYSVQNAASSQRTDYSLSNISSSKDDSININQSIFQEYLQKLKENSDGKAKETLQAVQNIPISQVSRLFDDLQVKSVEQAGKMFDDLKIKSTDEISSILAAAKNNAVQNTAKTQKPENQVLKFIDRSMESLSAANEKLREHSERMAEAREKLDAGFRRDANTGELDREKARAAARDFVERYNELADSLKDSGNGTVESKSKLISEMSDAYGKRLENVGITKDDSGRLTLDENKLDQASERDIERVFGKEDSFAEFIDGQAKQLAAYAQTDLYQRSSAYTDAGNVTQISNISGSYFNMLG